MKIGWMPIAHKPSDDSEAKPTGRNRKGLFQLGLRYRIGYRAPEHPRTIFSSVAIGEQLFQSWNMTALLFQSARTLTKISRIRHTRTASKFALVPHSGYTTDFQWRGLPSGQRSVREIVTIEAPADTPAAHPASFSPSVPDAQLRPTHSGRPSEDDHVSDTAIAQLLPMGCP